MGDQSPKQEEIPTDAVERAGLAVADVLDAMNEEVRQGVPRWAKNGEAAMRKACSERIARAAIAAMNLSPPAVDEGVVEQNAKHLHTWFGAGFWEDLPEHQRNLFRGKAMLLSTLTRPVVDEGWQPIETAPKDGTLVTLLVDYSDEGDHWIDDEASGLSRTIGHNNDDNVGDEERQGWQFAGWCWTHDHYTEGAGRPIKWRPLPAPPASLTSDQSRGEGR